MKPSMGFLAPLAAFGMAAPAYACMADPLPEAILFDYRPSNIPAGAMSILVRPVAQAPNTGSIRVRVLRTTSSLRAGDVIELMPEWLSSCTGDGRTDKPAFAVVVKPLNTNADKPFITKIYKRSWLDTLWAIFGWTTYTPSGAPLSDPIPHDR